MMEPKSLKLGMVVRLVSEHVSHALYGSVPAGANVVISDIENSNPKCYQIWFLYNDVRYFTYFTGKEFAPID